MLVGQIVTATWRLRRARTAETGEIALSVDGGWWRREKHNPLTRLLTMPAIPFAEGLVTQLEQSVSGCHYLLYSLNDLRKAVERAGELTEAVLNDFKDLLRQRPNAMSQNLEQFRTWLMANPEKLEPEVLRTRHKDEVLKYLDRKIRDLEYWMERREEREATEEQACQAAAMLPSEATLDKILRYETALLRQLNQAMNQLERLQRRRQGENIPAPLTVDISAKT